MTDCQRLNELHAATTQGAWHQCGANNGKCPCGLVWTGEADTVVARCKSVDDGLPRLSDEQVRANGDFIAESHNAWPAVAAELTKAREQAAATAEELVLCRASHATLMRGIKAAIGLDHWPEGGGAFPEAAISLLNGHLEKQAERLAVLEEFARLIKRCDACYDPDEVDLLRAVAWLDAETKKASIHAE